MRKIEPPTNCPCCGSELEWSNHLLYCRNPNCESQAEKKISHFAKALKIKGLGPVTIKKLGVRDVSQLYELTEDDIAELLSSDRLAEKLYYELCNSKNASLNRVLPGFSIPLIGKSAAEKLSTVCESIYDIRDETCRQAGLGPKATANLLDWLDKHEFNELPFNFKFEQPKQRDTVGIVCITGRLKSFGTKALATAALQEYGFDVKSSLTKDVTILVNESGIESAKTKRARETGVTIVTNLLEFLGE